MCTLALAILVRDTGHPPAGAHAKRACAFTDFGPFRSQVPVAAAAVAACRQLQPYARRKFRPQLVGLVFHPLPEAAQQAGGAAQGREAAEAVSRRVAGTAVAVDLSIWYFQAVNVPEIRALWSPPACTAKVLLDRV